MPRVKLSLKWLRSKYEIKIFTVKFAQMSKISVIIALC